MSHKKVFGAANQVLINCLPLRRNMATLTVKARNYNTKHLKKGDPLPPFNGKLRIYNMRFCPYAQRTILALNAKNIDYEIVNINLRDKPEWLASKSAFEKVPAIEVKEGVVVYESLVTAEYLDDIYPERPLRSKDPLRNAYDKIIIESSGMIHSMMAKVITAPETIDDNAIKSYFKGLTFIQNELEKRGTKFLGGDLPGYADYMIWPWFERLPIVQKYNPKLNFGPTYKLLSTYIQNMKKDSAVSDYIISDDICEKYFESYKTGQPRYDLLEN